MLKCHYVCGWLSDGSSGKKVFVEKERKSGKMFTMVDLGKEHMHIFILLFHFHIFIDFKFCLFCVFGGRVSLSSSGWPWTNFLLPKCCSFIYLFIYCSTGVWAQGFTLARLIEPYCQPLLKRLKWKKSPGPWLTPVILATAEAEIRRIVVWSQPRHIGQETLS
jgi:hypothetical protein